MYSMYSYYIEPVQSKDRVTTVTKDNNQNRDELQNLSSVIMQSKNDIVEILRLQFLSLPMVKLVGGKNSREGIGDIVKFQAEKLFMGE